MNKLLGYVNRFVYGEVSPLVYSARGDLDKYSAACKEMLNFIPLLQGPARRRGGTRFVAEAANSGRPVALLDFIFSEEISYVIEAGDGYLRFYSQGLQVMNGSFPYQVAAPWRQDDLFDARGICRLKWVQSADVMYVVCPGKPPQKLMRYGHTDWRIRALPGWSPRPNASAVALFRERLCLAAGQTVYMSQSGAFENFEVSTGRIPEVVLTCNTAGIIEVEPPAYGGAGVLSMVFPSVIRVNVSFVPEEVSFVVSNGSRRVVVKPRAGQDGLSRFGVKFAGGNAAHLTFDSLTGAFIVANGAGRIEFDPDKGEISRNLIDENDSYIVRYSNTAIAADDPIEINVYSERMDGIEWLCPAASLLAGTTGGEFAIRETTSVDPMGPENIKVDPETSFGSSPIQALRVGSVVLFVQRAGRKVREFVYDYTGDSYAAADVTMAAEHITQGGLTSLVWQSEPIETLWAARSDGVLLGFTYSKDQDMFAWHRHELGGGGKVVHLAVIPAVHGGRDELWMSVARVVGGREVQYIERMEAGFGDGREQAEAFFVDSGVTVRGAALAEVGGLEHLEGFEVDILGDGGVQPRQTVSGGKVVLRRPADVVQVGLPYRSRLVTVNLDAPLRDGTAQARIKKIVKVTLRLLDALGGAVGPDGGDMLDLYFRDGDDPFDAPPRIFSGDKTVVWPGGYERDGVVAVVQDYPLPFTLAAIIPEVNIGGMHS